MVIGTGLILLIFLVFAIFTVHLIILHEQACKGLRNIFSAKVQLVPIKEMTDVLSVESKSIDLTRDTWVRMKLGIYKGDLAKVSLFHHKIWSDSYSFYILLMPVLFSPCFPGCGCR